MNDTRRRQLKKAADLLEQAKAIIEQVMEEEQEAYDNMPEGLQNSERGETMEENIYDLENAESDFDDLYDIIYTIVDR